MNLVFENHHTKTKVVESVQQRYRDDATLRLARIANGAEPKYQNGHPKDAEKGRRKGTK